MKKQENVKHAPSVDERVQDLLDDARVAREAGDWRLAQSLVNAALVLDPANTAAANMIVGPATRRQMTLLFCDIVESTQMADGRDPEEVSSVLRAYRATCTEVVDRFGGFIDDNRGDGMLVLFGYPQVHEDDAKRAVQCGRAIISTLPRRLRAILGREEDVLQVRIAVHTDLVVLDGVGVAGATANEAARLQEFAHPNTVVLSDTTKALVWPYFETASNGIVELRGVSRPMEIFAVVRERNTADPAVATTPFVGRQEELAELHAFLTGTMPILVVYGQPGVGKSRLIAEVTRRYRIPIVECRCSRFQQNASLQAFRPIIETACHIDESDGPDDRLNKLRTRVGAEMGTYGDLPFLAAALDIPSGLLSAPVAVNPDLLRERALRAAAEIVGSATANGPMVLFIDDVHWADQSSIDLITHLVTAGRPEGLKLVLTTRDGFVPPWPNSHVTRLNLETLSFARMRELAELMPEGSSLAAEDLNELIERSDGIPLFLEELLRTADALGRGQAVNRSIRFGDYQIPPALRDPLLARLASPQVDLELVQMAATIGRDVDRTVLRRIVGGGNEEFQIRLDSLLATGLVELSERGFRFRHELLREAAYETQKRSTRRQNHRAIADLLGRLSPEMSPRIAGEKANHLERANRYSEAITAHLEAATADQAVGAHVEVTNRLTHTLDLVHMLPEGPERHHIELRVRGMRSFSAVTTGGYGAPEAAVDYRRSVELCEMLAGAPEIVPTLINTWVYYAFRGELAEAEDAVAGLVRECAAAGNPMPASEIGFGITEFLRGRFAKSQRMLEGFVASDWGTTPDRPPPVWPLPNDPVAASAAHLAFIRWIEGEPEAGNGWSDYAFERANRLAFPYGPFTVCYIDHFLASIRTLEGDYPAVAGIGAHMLGLADRHGFALWQLTAALHLEFSAVILGQHDMVDKLSDHVVMAREVLAADNYTPYWLTQLGVAQQVAGRPNDARRSLDQALEVADGNGSVFFSAETLRIRGKLRVETGDPDGIGDVHDAIDLAVRQGATAFAQRARSTLAELSAT